MTPLSRESGLLPIYIILARKWDVIDLNYTSRHIIASELRERVIEAHKAGMRNKDIAEKFNTSKSNVTKIIKTYE